MKNCDFKNKKKLRSNEWINEYEPKLKGLN